jgi:hypothetical protein
VMNMPATFFLDMVKNSDADENDSGFQSGLSVVISDKWKFTYLYKEIESDSTVWCIDSLWFWCRRDRQ